MDNSYSFKFRVQLLNQFDDAFNTDLDCLIKRFGEFAQDRGFLFLDLEMDFILIETDYPYMNKIYQGHLVGRGGNTSPALLRASISEQLYFDAGADSSMIRSILARQIRSAFKGFTSFK